MIKKIAVYLGSRFGNCLEYREQAKELGKFLVKHNLELVYGGGKEGLMGILAEEVLKKGGYVHGVTTKQLFNRGTAYEAVQDLKILSTMDQRKLTMMNEADGMLAFPGGIGTLEEISQAISWISLGDNAKPVAFYNYHGYYNDLQKMFLHMNKEGFLETSYVKALCFSDSFDKILQFMRQYQAPASRQY